MSDFPLLPSPSLRRLAASAGLAALLAACAADPAQTPTLYQRLGGAEQVTRVVGRTIDRAASDARTRRSFDDVKLGPLKDSIVQQICSIAGGGCRYEGETMAKAHADAHIGASEFDALVTILREELDAAGTDPGAKNELLRLLAPMKRDVVSQAGPRDRAEGS